jgi:hypothetical protein
MMVNSKFACIIKLILKNVTVFQKTVRGYSNRISIHGFNLAANEESYLITRYEEA